MCRSIVIRQCEMGISNMFSCVLCSWSRVEIERCVNKFAPQFSITLYGRHPMKWVELMFISRFIIYSVFLYILRNFACVQFVHQFKGKHIWFSLRSSAYTVQLQWFAWTWTKIELAFARSKLISDSSYIIRCAHTYTESCMVSIVHRGHRNEDAAWPM